MKSAVETLSPTRAKLTVEVPFEELKPSLDAAYQQIAKQINVPGFRRGKVPPAVIDRQVGREAVLDQAINELLPQKYMEALQAQLPRAAGPARDRGHQARRGGARVHRRGGRQARDHPARLRRPRGRGRGHRRSPTPTSRSRSRRCASGSPPCPTSSGPAADGDFVVIDLTATRDGEVVDGAELTGMSYQVGRGGMIDGLDEALVGMAAGDEKTFTTQLVGGDLVGQDVEVQVDGQPGPGAGAPRARRRLRPGGLGVRHRRRAERRRPRAARPRQAARAGRRRARRRPRGAAREDGGAAARGHRHRRAQRPPPVDRAAARLRRA